MYTAYVWVISRCLVSNEDVPLYYEYGMQHKPLSTTEGQRVALVNFRSLTEIRGDSINSGHRWSEKRKLSTWMGTSKKKLPMRFDDGLCECIHYGPNREGLHHQA